MKRIKAVHPYHYPTGSNFKEKPFFAWKDMGGLITEGIYPSRFLRKFVHLYDILPTVTSKREDVRLCFVQPLSLYYDTFSSVLSHEIVPFIWDCWPIFDEKLCKWIERHKVKACIFTSMEAAERIRNRLPLLKVLVITEGVCCEDYPAGRKLVDRDVDFYLFGRWPSYVSKTDLSAFNHKRNGNDEEFRERLKNSKITVNVPRCDVVPKQTGGQETLTQRYWECMLSRMVMVGRAPKELTDLIGYNPVIDIDRSNFHGQLKHITTHIEDYQDLVDRNRETALKMGSWDIRMKQVMEWLKELGYEV